MSADDELPAHLRAAELLHLCPACEGVNRDECNTCHGEGGIDTEAWLDWCESRFVAGDRGER